MKQPFFTFSKVTKVFFIFLFLFLIVSLLPQGKKTQLYAAPSSSLLHGIGPMNGLHYVPTRPLSFEVQSVQKIAEACASLVVIGLDWPDIEPNPPVGGQHTYTWTHVDAWVDTASANGMKVVAGIVQ